MREAMCRPLLLLLAVVGPALGRTLFFSAAGSSPEQVHLSYGDLPSHMVVTWNTRAPVPGPAVRFGADQRALNESMGASSSLFVDGGDLHLNQTIHRARLVGLRPGTRYWYRVGSDSGQWSDLFSFVTMRAGTEWSPRLAVYGDFGYDNPQSLPRLLRDTQKGLYDAVLHVGDFAYDMATDNGRMGDKFMRLIQPIAANLPYMTCVGNHENHYNFTNYKARFSMPGNSENMFYSFNMGPVHFVGISTEFYYYIYYGIVQIKNQYNWLVNDLKVANEPANRAKRPWIILFGHRPMYCTNNDGDCGFMADIIRTGVPILGWYALEPLLGKYGVDLAIWAHEHSYERMFPVYNKTVLNGSIPGEPYTDPKAPVHIVTGSAGCQERHDSFGHKAPFSAFRSDDYGYSRLHVINGTHLTFEQVSDDKNGTIIDGITLVRHKHTPFI